MKSEGDDTDGEREDSDTTSHNSAPFHREREGDFSGIPALSSEVRNPS